MGIIRAIARRICCAAGDHCYSAVKMNFTFLSDDRGSWCYETSNECIYCGRPYYCLVNIPKPRILQKNSEAGDMIQHVGYDDEQCGREK